MAFIKYTFAINIISFILFPTLLIATPRSNSFNNQSSPYSLGNRSDRTRMKTGWGMQNTHPSMVDLSEWGGERPSCDEAPECPVCIP